ncbi:MAG: urease accessory protein UreD [Pseudomonadota bacterium]
MTQLIASDFMGAVPAAHAGGWRAQLELAFATCEGRSFLARRRHFGPLYVQRPFYPEGAAVCHVYILHPPGGVVGGDELAINIHVEARAHALVTTPASGKFYCSAGATASLTQQIHVASGGVLEWLPQDNIFFSGSRVDIKTNVYLAADSVFAGWEIGSLGRPAAAEYYAAGQLSQRFEIWRDGVPLCVERSACSGNSRFLHTAWGLRGHAVMGTMLCVTSEGGLISRIRELMQDDIYADIFTVTRLDDVLVCRYLGNDAAQARRCFARVWAAVRPLLLGRAACMPRIWST